MKLGTETGSVMNHLKAVGTVGEPTPEVGMGVTVLMWSDRRAGTIQRIFVDRGQAALEITEDKSTLVAGSTMSEEQEYKFEANPSGRKHYFKKVKGVWREFHYRVLDSQYDAEADVRHDVCSKFLSRSSGGSCLRLGERDTYTDPTF